ncbi:MAG TPA: PH domain-containing protein [Pyrinomonadaceae bacterium]|nr:PH domain-containing protein [Pyrinomonadaceae bacterium]
MIYKSKKDWWLFGLVWGAVLAPLVFGLFNVLGGNAQLGWSLVRTGIMIGAAVLFTTYPLDYEITSGELVARSGFMRWRVLLGSIQEVSASRNPASAPAWSLDRLRVEYVKNGAERSLYISPRDKRAFMRDLADAAPGLELRGDRVVRGM